MSKMLSTNNLPESSNKLPKKLAPGSRMAKILAITLAAGYNHEQTGAYDLILHVEGPDLGDGFEGFFIDKDNQSKGRYKGQIGSVKASQYSFQSKVLNAGQQNEMKIDRDLSILQFLNNLAMELGKIDELKTVEVPTIEEYVPAASSILKGETFLEFCFAGREWVDKNNYTNYELFLPKFVKGKRPFVAEGNESKLIKFNEAEHIIRKKAAVTVKAFEPVVGADFDL